jgi:hypothetical protein
VLFSFKVANDLEHRKMSQVGEWSMQNSSLKWSNHLIFDESFFLVIEWLLYWVVVKLKTPTYNSFATYSISINIWLYVKVPYRGLSVASFSHHLQLNYILVVLRMFVKRPVNVFVNIHVSRLFSVKTWFVLKQT